MQLYNHYRTPLLESNSVVTRELIPLLYVESAIQYLLQSVQPPLLRGL